MIDGMTTYRVTAMNDNQNVLAEFGARDIAQAEFMARHHASGSVYKLWALQGNGSWLDVDEKKRPEPWTNRKPKDVHAELETSQDGELNF